MVDAADLPPEAQSAWQRWELASFGDNRPTAVARAAAEKSARAALTQQLSEQIAESRDAARAEGQALGHLEGLAAGRAQGLAEGREAAAAEREQLRQLAAEFTEALSQANGVVAQDLLALAMDIAQAMLRTALAVRPELLLPLVSDLVSDLPAARGPSVLLLHDDDAALIRTHLGETLDKEGWRIRTDPQLQRGGCRIETASQQVDADTGLRWQRIARALGQDVGWLGSAAPAPVVSAA